jgi:hypothetical protein
MFDNEKTLAEWETMLQQEAEHWQGERNRTDFELQRTLKKLELVRQMRLLGNAPTSDLVAVVTTAKEGRATPTSVREMAQKILADAKRPLHISEIHKEFRNRGYAIPGSGTAFNILAHLVNSKLFVRVARGTYAVAGSVPENQVLPRAERKARRRRRKKKSRLGQGLHEG